MTATHKLMKALPEGSVSLKIVCEDSVGIPVRPLRKLQLDSTTELTGLWYKKQSLNSPWGFQEDEDPRFRNSKHMKVERLCGHLVLLVFVRGWVDPQSHTAVGRIMSMKNSNRTRDFPACSVVPLPTAPPRAYVHILYFFTNYMCVSWLVTVCVI